MNNIKTYSMAALLAISMTLVACGKDDTTTEQPASSTPAVDAQVAEKPVRPIADTGVASPGKPRAPISMSYEIMSKPVVGMPVQINVEVSSNQGPVTVSYNIADASALNFVEGQVRKLAIEDPSIRHPRQLSVIPQREGRLYVNVSAEVLTPGGSMIRSMAIPIKVGSAPEEATINGELKQGPDGETVISLPATEEPPP